MTAAAASVREKDLAKREADLAAREQALRAREQARRSSGAASGGGDGAAGANWPVCSPVIHHNIREEVPPDWQGPVTKAYWSYLVRTLVHPPPPPLPRTLLILLTMPFAPLQYSPCPLLYPLLIQLHSPTPPHLLYNPSQQPLTAALSLPTPPPLPSAQPPDSIASTSPRH